MMLQLEKMNAFCRRVAKQRWAQSICSAAVLAIAVAASPREASRQLLAVSISPAAPRAVTPFTSFDFGDVYTGETISQIFIIKNEGDAELQIKEFKGG